MKIEEILAAGKIIPVIVINDAAQAVPLAKALMGGGIRVLEVTLRTRAALDAVRAIRANVPDAIVGTGTVLSHEDVQASVAAGARFGVSPGSSPKLLAAVRDAGLPFLPGAMTPSEVLAAREAGFRALKLFPATQAGGVGMLKALGSVFPDVKFCPTGGIDANNAAEYLALPNVACVGGSWLVPADLMKAGDWNAIKGLAQTASQMGRFPI
jgi:2-dehydro-3-deoxyphosphogluconate aldolase/(4S)-4-hydroxy-2-oxoglutarate aldolase